MRLNFLMAAGLLAAASLPCAAPAVAPPAAGTARVLLHECRLQHPLRLASIMARCGDLAVAEEPGAAQGARITLHFAVVAALDRASRGTPLFVLAGGPGQSAIDLYTGLAGAFARSNRSHDIVLLDQRGTGRSAPLDCRYPQEWRAETALAATRQATQDCLARFGPRVRYYTSSVAVADLEAVRRALGYARINLYGASYGTRVAQLYMRRHPETVRTAILDGVTDPPQVIGLETPLDGERALAQIIARCRDSRECAGAFPRIDAELGGLRQDFGPARREVVLADPFTAQPRTIEFNRLLFGAALRFLSYGAAQASLLPALIHEAAQGNFAPLAAQPLITARQVEEQLASGMQNTVICSEDAPFYAVSAAQRARLLRTYQGTDQIDALQAICAIWPRGPVDADLHAPLRSDVPTLLLSGEDDPVTPPAAAERARAGLRRSRHLVLAGEGHGQLATACVPRLIARFLDDADPQHLDADCLARHRPPGFFVSATGPSP